jgi:hypothetical protein
MFTKSFDWEFEIRDLISLIPKQLFLLPKAVVILIVLDGVTKGGGHV